jgi:hypothetical protein
MLDSIDESAGSEMDQEFIKEIQRRRDEMMRGEEIVVDWRRALSSIERSLAAENDP